MRFSDLLFDRRCGICDCHISDGAVCKSCDEEILSLLEVRKRRLCEGPFKAEVTYLFDYDVPVVKRLLFKLKRSSNKDLFRYAASLYERAVPDGFGGVVTNCPRRGAGRRQYGYDQVEIPCRLLCKNSGGMLKYERLLSRKSFSKEQKNLTLEERRKNTKDVFRVTKKDIPENILVFDDVVTTGSTVLSCVSELKKRRKDAEVSIVCLASRNIFSREG